MVNENLHKATVELAIISIFGALVCDDQLGKSLVQICETMEKNKKNEKKEEIEKKPSSIGETLKKSMQQLYLKNVFLPRVKMVLQGGKTCSPFIIPLVENNDDDPLKKKTRDKLQEVFVKKESEFSTKKIDLVLHESVTGTVKEKRRKKCPRCQKRIEKRMAKLSCHVAKSPKQKKNKGFISKLFSFFG